MKKDRALNYLGIFAKYWEPGKVKTRLAAGVGNETASRIYLAFLSHLLTRLSQCGDERSIGYFPSDRKPDFLMLTQDETWRLAPQQGLELGDRMKHFFDWTFQNSNEDSCKVVLIGSDTPHLSAGTVDKAFTALSNNDIVLGPSTDGGYYLIGMSNRTHEIFENVNWSTSSVLEQTIEHIKQQQLSFHLLESMTDIDEPADLEDLMEKIKNAPEHRELAAAICQAQSQSVESERRTADE